MLEVFGDARLKLDYRGFESSVYMHPSFYGTFKVGRFSLLEPLNPTSLRWKPLTLATCEYQREMVVKKIIARARTAEK